MMELLWLLLILYAMIQLADAGSCSRTKTLEYDKETLGDKRALTMESLDKACVKVARATYDEPASHLQLLVWGYTKDTKELVSMVAQVKMDCKGGIPVPAEVNGELCAIINGDVCNCITGHEDLNQKLTEQLIPALKGERRKTSDENCASTGTTASEAKTKAGRVETLGYLRLDSESGQILRSSDISVAAVAGIAGGKNEGKLLVVLDSDTKTNNFVIIHALATKKLTRWKVESNDVVYATDGKIVEASKVETDLKEAVNAETIAAALKTVSANIQSRRQYC